MAAGDLLRTQRREKLQKIALWLADSGNHADCQAVEATLCTHYGVLEVRQLLGEPNIRAELERRCTCACERRGKANG
jgi:hypothetical protein